MSLFKNAAALFLMATLKKNFTVFHQFKERQLNEIKNESVQQKM